jgi:hypothetical protein
MCFIPQRPSNFSVFTKGPQNFCSFYNLVLNFISYNIAQGYRLVHILLHLIVSLVEPTTNTVPCTHTSISRHRASEPLDLMFIDIYRFAGKTTLNDLVHHHHVQKNWYCVRANLSHHVCRAQDHKGPTEPIFASQHVP